MPTGDTELFISILNTYCAINLTHIMLCVRNQGCWDETKRQVRKAEQHKEYEVRKPR